MINAVITGGGTGIGRAIATSLASTGGTICVCGRSPATLAATVAAIEDRGGSAAAVEVDVSDRGSVTAAAEWVARVLGGVDVLVNCAGAIDGAPVEQSDIDRWLHVVDVNLTGTYLMTRAILPSMRNRGRIVNISSILGRFGVAGYSAYCAAKHGVIGFTRALALELTAREITANVICPGWVDTDMAAERMRQGAAAAQTSFEAFRASALSAVPINRLIQPDEVAQLVSFLVSPAAAAITGQTYNMCGGQRMD